MGNGSNRGNRLLSGSERPLAEQAHLASGQSRLFEGNTRRGILSRSQP